MSKKHALKQTKKKKASASKTIPLIKINKEQLASTINFPSSPIEISWMGSVSIFLIFSSIFVLYLVTMMPSVPPGDSGEFITSAYILGVPHPPGYPLYNLIGKLFSFIPFGSIAWRINCSSAVFNLGASFFIYLTLYRLIQDWPAAIIGAMFFALCPIIWEYSLKAEVFPLNNLFASGIIYLLVLLREHYFKKKEQRDDVKNPTIIYSLMFICGLALTNHHTIILLAPSVILALLYYGKPILFDLKSASIALVFFVLGLSLYLYIPIRAHAQPYINWDNAATLKGFITLVTRADYGSLQLMAANGATYGTLEKYSIYLVWLTRQVSYLGILLGLSGLFFLLRQKEKLLGILFILSYGLSSFLFLFLANIAKDSPTILGLIERFYMLPMVFFAVFIGLGVYYIKQCVFSWFNKSQKKELIINAMIVVIVTIGTFLNFSYINQLNNTIFYNYGKNVLNSVEKNAVLLTQGDTPTHVLYYLQQVEGYRKDVIILVKNHFTSLWYWRHIKKMNPWVKIPFAALNNRELALKQFIHDNLGKRPLYDTDFLNTSPDPKAGYQLRSAGIVNKIDNTRNISEEEFKKTEAIWKTYNTSNLSSSFPINSQEKSIANLYASYHFQFAYEYLQIGLYDKALQEYEKALHLNAYLAGAYKNMGIIYAHFKHDPTHALFYFNKYQRLEPKDRDDAMLSFIKQHTKKT